MMRTHTKSILALLPLALSISSLAYSAGAFSPPEGKALYAVIADPIPGNRYIRNERSAEIMRLSPNTEKPELESICEFDDVILDEFYNFKDARVTVLGGGFRSWPHGRLLAFSHDRPWAIRYRCPTESFSGRRNIFEKEGKAYLVYKEKGEAKLNVILLPDMTPLDIPQDQWDYPAPDQPGVPGAPWMINSAFENLTVPTPSEDMLEESDRANLISRGPRHVLIERYIPSLWLREHRTRTFAYYDRVHEKWQRFAEKGNLTEAKAVGPWLAFRVGWKLPISDSSEPYWVYTGEWIVVSPHTGTRQSIILDSDSDILMATEDALFMRSDHALVHCPLRSSGPEPIDTEHATVLCRGDEVQFIKSLFFGPRTTPAAGILRVGKCDGDEDFPEEEEE